MEQEAPQELMCRKGHNLLLAAVRVVAPEKGNLAFAKVHEPMVGNGHAMRVTGQILQDLIWASEGRLGVDHPVTGEQCLEEMVKVLGVSDLLKRTVELELVGSVQILECSGELATEDTAERHDRQEKALGAVDPPRSICRQPTCGNDVMDVWMETPTATVP